MRVWPTSSRSGTRRSPGNKGQEHTEDGRPLQFVTLEDEHGLVEVTLFPGTCPQVAYLTMGPYLAGGVVDDQYGVLTVTARSFERCT